MDIARSPEIVQRRRRRRFASAVVVSLGVIGTTVALARLKPAAPTVDGGALWIDTVKRGTIFREVRGTGVLVPDDIRWITALTEGRVERVPVRPGTGVTPDTVILELSNPQTEQAALTAELDLKAARAQYEVLKADLEKDLLAQRAAAAMVDADAAQAAMDAEANDAMAKEGLISAIIAKQSRLKAELNVARQKLEHSRLVNSEQSIAARLEVQHAEVERRQTMMTLRRNEALGLKVRAGMTGVLQEVPADVGQRIGPGTNLARVADPARLRAQLQIAETQMKDVAVSQLADIDTRNGIVKGHVVRVDPAAKSGTVTVDVALDQELPKGARPDNTIDGVIQLERMENILYVGRPAMGQEHAMAALFRLTADDGTASLTQVQLGRGSVNHIEIIRGLNAGDRVVLSDMSQWDGYDKVRLK